MKRLGVIAVLLATAYTARAADTHAPVYTLEECIDLGLEQAIRMRNARRDVEIAEAGITEARAAALPQASLSAQYERLDEATLAGRENRTVSGRLEQLLFAGGRVRSAVRAARAYRGLVSDGVDLSRASLIRDIRLGFHGVLLAREQVEVREQSVATLRDFVEDATAAYRAGAASEFDQLSAEVRLANERPALIDARNRLETAKRRFRDLVYLEPETFRLRGELAYRPFPYEYHELLSGIDARRPELRRQEDTIRLREADVAHARSEYFPEITAGGNYLFQKPDPYSFFLSDRGGWEDSWTLTLSAEWPIFTGLSRRARIAQRRLEVTKAEDTLRDLRRQVELEVRTQWLELKRAESLIDSTAKNVTRAERALEIARTRYRAGRGTQLEYTQANLDLSTARLQHVEALRDYADAEARLRYAAGLTRKERSDESEE
ncbi:TolC family protein [Kiritimatiella glycovorans]|uniref:Outer membrane channel protein n=1 Tax=Kiritimatiella glycovorans TaxID=1307763 RepID=A0A0G3EC14_9BACT|nr:TolC family protein [Kiritimatiella glycovorans]AKJ64036.1 outer membrane channel protein [Kiritimatiella glycovorans]